MEQRVGNLEEELTLKNTELELASHKVEALEDKNFGLESDNAKVEMTKLKLTIEKMSSNEEEVKTMGAETRDRHLKEVEKLGEAHLEEKREWNQMREGSLYKLWTPGCGSRRRAFVDRSSTTIRSKPSSSS